VELTQYTTAQAARRLQMTRGKVRYLIAQGELEARKIDGRLYLSAEQVDAKASSRRDRPG